VPTPASRHPRATPKPLRAKLHENRRALTGRHGATSPRVTSVSSPFHPELPRTRVPSPSPRRLVVCLLPGSRRAASLPLSRVESPPSLASPLSSPTAPNPGRSRRRPRVIHVPSPFPLSARHFVSRRRRFAVALPPGMTPLRRVAVLSVPGIPPLAASRLPPASPRLDCQLAAASRQASSAYKRGPQAQFSPHHCHPSPSLSPLSFSRSSLRAAISSCRSCPPSATVASEAPPEVAAAPAAGRRASPRRRGALPPKAEQSARKREKKPSRAESSSAAVAAGSSPEFSAASPTAGSRAGTRRRGASSPRPNQSEEKRKKKGAEPLTARPHLFLLPQTADKPGPRPSPSSQTPTGGPSLPSQLAEYSNGIFLSVNQFPIFQKTHLFFENP
jgi:hypothetical protein